MSHQEQHLTYIPLEEGRTFRVLSDIMTFKLGRADTQGAFFLCFDQVPPQGGAAMHRQQGQETFVIFEGELEFSTQDESETSTFTASRGAVVHVPAGGSPRLRKHFYCTSIYACYFHSSRIDRTFFRANRHTCYRPRESTTTNFS